MKVEQERSAICPFCEKETQEKWWEKDGKSFYLCSSCDLLFAKLLDPKEALSQNQEVFEPVGKQVLEGLEAHRQGKKKKHRKILSYLEPYRSTGRLLDVGCGQGGFLQTAKEMGWTVEGVELAPPLAELVEKYYGIPVHVGTLEELRLPSGYYDVVFFNELLEHIYTPRSFLEEVLRILRKGGAVFLRTRNHRSFSAWFCQEDWRELAFLEKGHVCFYSPRTVRRIFSTLGFHIRHIRTWGVSIHAPYPKGSCKYHLAKLANKLLEPGVRLFQKGHRIEVLAEKV